MIRLLQNNLLCISEAGGVSVGSNILKKRILQISLGSGLKKDCRQSPLMRTKNLFRFHRVCIACLQRSFARVLGAAFHLFRHINVKFFKSFNSN